MVVQIDVHSIMRSQKSIAVNTEIDYLTAGVGGYILELHRELQDEETFFNIVHICVYHATVSLDCNVEKQGAAGRRGSSRF